MNSPVVRFGNVLNAEQKELILIGYEECKQTFLKNDPSIILPDWFKVCWSHKEADWHRAWRVEQRIKVYIAEYIARVNMTSMNLGSNGSIDNVTDVQHLMKMRVDFDNEFSQIESNSTTVYFYGSPHCVLTQKRCYCDSLCSHIRNQDCCLKCWASKKLDEVN